MRRQSGGTSDPFASDLDFGELKQQTHRRIADAAGPGRFRRRPTPPRLPKAVFINEPAKENTTIESVT
jgi:hypothetical protein